MNCAACAAKNAEKNKYCITCGVPLGASGAKGDVRAEVLSASASSEKAHSPEESRTATASATLTHDEWEISKSGKGVYEPLDLESMDTAYLPAERPFWPVSQITLLNAGDFSQIMKTFLDDMEPIILILADEIGVGEDRFQEARNIVMATGYLLICQTLNDAHYSMGHRWENVGEVHAQRDLRVHWLDAYPNSVWEHVGWGYNDDFDWALLNRNPGKRLVELIDVIMSALGKYDCESGVHLYRSAVVKTVQSMCELIRLKPKKMFRSFGIEEFVPITDWVDFVQKSQPYVNPDVFETFNDALQAITLDHCKGNETLARLHMLREFAVYFQPPYSMDDMDLWKEISEATLVPLRKAEKTKDFVRGLIRDAFEPQTDTVIPDPDVFKEIRQDIDQFLSPEFETWHDAARFFKALQWYQFSIATRSHFLSNRRIKAIQQAWDSANEIVEELLEIDNQRLDSIRDESYLEEIEKLVGLEPIKARLRTLGNLAASDGQSVHLPIASHIIFSGNPGTGKTTVARLIGQIYAALGVLPKGHVVSVTRADLVAQYLGQTAPKVNEAVQKAMGGILFIDEAYTLKRGMSENDSFGQEAIDSLLTHMEDSRGKFMVIAAGYPAEMSRFVDSNPGLGSRFSENWQFDDYSESELWAIFQTFAATGNVGLDDSSQVSFIALAGDAKKAKNFANARWVRNTFQEATIRFATRLSEGDSVTSLTASDFASKPVPKVIDDVALASIDEKLNSLIGLGNVKEDIRDLIALQALQVRRAQSGLPALGNPLGHLIFAGPPGTGKTTVARIIGQIYMEMGLLNSGHVVETQRADLVAAYVGQTAIKTEEMVNKAMGGVLFVDEAYTLARPGNSSGQDYGQESIDTILKIMEDRKGDFVLIAAGYEDRMAEFVQSNPGLASRFSKTLNFEKWNADALIADVRARLKAQDLVLDAEAEAALLRVASEITELESYASGRTSRSFVERIVEAQARRLADSKMDSLTEILSIDLTNGCDRLRGSRPSPPNSRSIKLT